MRIFNPTHAYVRRVLPWMPPGLALELFCNLLRIIETPAIPTAAVVVVPNKLPQMLINPQFVEDHIKHDAHLALLVLHELYHILFAHMMLGNSFLHNIAFDAIINAYLARKMRGYAYQGFFEQFNPAEELPGVFLRPPEGWPYAPKYPTFNTRGVTQMLKRLYPPASDIASTRLPLTREVYDLLKRAQAENEMSPNQNSDENGEQGLSHEQIMLREMFREILDHHGEDAFADLEKLFLPHQSSDSEPKSDTWSDAVLLGNHDSTNQDQQALKEQLAEYMDIAEILSQRPDKEGDADGTKMMGSGRGSSFQWKPVKLVNPKARARQKFWNLLHYIMHQSETTGNPIRVGEMELTAYTPGLLFNPNDRYVYSRMELTGSVISRQPTVIRTRHLPPAATLYLDVSASMKDTVDEMVSLVRPFVQHNILHIYEFSTRVTPVNDLTKIGSTGGTDINCVLRHMIESRQQLGQVIILTDGDVGDAKPDLVQGVKRLRVPIYGVLTYNMRRKMRAFVTQFVNLS